VLEHLGDPMRVNNTVASFIEWRKASGLSDYMTQGTYGVPYSDPATTPGEEFRFDVCGELNAAASGVVPENPQGVICKTLPGGRCAVVRHVGAATIKFLKPGRRLSKAKPNSTTPPRTFLLTW